MGRILVESRSDLNVKPTLDALAACCIELGHEVVRWRGPLSGRVRYSRRLSDCDLAIVWNGIHEKYDRYIETLRARDVPILFAELGWFPQKQTFQLDPCGVNAAASWVTSPAPREGRELSSGEGESRRNSFGNCVVESDSAPSPPAEIFPGRNDLVGLQNQSLPAPPGDLLVILQDDEDTNLKLFSPWFPNMLAFVQFLATNSAIPLRVRAHPSHTPDPRLADWMFQNDRGAIWDRSEGLTVALETCAAVACVNSSSAIEAMHRNVPVLCYGKSVFRQPRAVHCLNANSEATQRVTAKIAAGETEVFPDAIDELTRRISDQQWRIEQIPDRLPPLLAEHLVPRELTLTRQWSRKLSGLVFGIQRGVSKAA